MAGRARRDPTGVILVADDGEPIIPLQRRDTFEGDPRTAEWDVTERKEGVARLELGPFLPYPMMHIVSEASDFSDNRRLVIAIEMSAGEPSHAEMCRKYGISLNCARRPGDRPLRLGRPDRAGSTGRMRRGCGGLRSRAEGASAGPPRHAPRPGHDMCNPSGARRVRFSLGPEDAYYWSCFGAESGENWVMASCLRVRIWRLRTSKQRRRLEARRSSHNAPWIHW